jgi:hypothetical protein
MKKGFMLLIYIGLFLSIASSAYGAASVTVQTPSEGQEVYIENSFTATFKCNLDANMTVLSTHANITKAGILMRNYASPTHVGSDQYSVSVNPESHLGSSGNYVFNADCTVKNTSTNATSTVYDSNTFKIYTYSLDIVSPLGSEPPANAYPGGELTVEVLLKKVIGTSEQEVTSGSTRFNVILTDLCGDIYIADDELADFSQGALQIETEIPTGLAEECFGLHDLVVEYEDDTSVYDEETDAVELKEAFKLSFEDEGGLQLSQGGDKSIKVNVFYGGGSINFNNLEFKATLYDEGGSKSTLAADKSSCAQSETGAYCTLTISVPNKNPGLYNLVIEGEYDNEEDIFTYTLEKDIEFAILFADTVRTASGQYVDMSMKMTNLATGNFYEIRTGGTGSFSRLVLPGVYEIEMSLPEIHKLLLHDVEVIEDTFPNTITYDTFVGGNIGGIDVAKIVVFEFALPFKRADVWLRYDDSKIADETQMQVFVCHNWNYGRRECPGEWATVPFSINTVNNIVSFNVSELSAFIVGGRRSLGVTTTLSKTDYYLDEQITLTGSVIDNTEVAVGGATVSYKIRGTSKRGSVTTDANGNFIIGSLSAPSTPGSYTIELGIDKNPYVPVNVTKLIKVTRQKDFTLLAPDTHKIYLGKATTVNLTVYNSGQDNFSSISLYSSGISTKWYQMFPQKLNDVKKGERRNVELRIEVPREDCADNKCKLYYFINIDAEGDEDIEKSTSITLELSMNESGGAGVEAATGDVFDVSGLLSLGNLPSISLLGSNPFGAIGDLLSNPYVLVVAIIGVLFVVVSMAKGGGGGGKGTSSLYPPPPTARRGGGGPSSSISVFSQLKRDIKREERGEL